MSDIEQMLKQLRDNYLNELPEKIERIESIVLNLKKYKDIDDFRELYRHIHSQKGTAGTHGLPFLTVICHQLEDELSDIGENMDLITDTQIQHWLTYLDLFSEAVEQIKQGAKDTSEIENALKNLRNVLTETTYSCMLVDTKSATLNVIIEVLKQHSIHPTIVDDGYEALGRLLVDKFDMLICGMKISSLSGIGLITAIKTSASVNQNIPSILITSTSFNRTMRDDDPDFVIQKDTSLPRVLNEACEKILSKVK